MAFPVIALVGVAALIGLALSKKSASTASGGAAVTPGAATNAGIPSFPGAAGALNNAAGAPALPPAPAPPAFGFPPAAWPPVPIELPPTVISVPPSGPPPVSDGSGGVVVPIVPVTIVGNDGSGGGTTAQTAPWDSGSMILPDPSKLPHLSGKYTAQSQESSDVQAGLNNWAAAVGFQTSDAHGNQLIPLTEDGFYGPDTQLAAAGFQVWCNATRNAGLAVDGEAGPKTQTYLLDWNSISPGGY